MSFIGNKRALLGNGIDPDVSLWIGAVLANGGNASSGYIRFLSTFVRAEKACGAWYRRDDYWMLRAETSVQALTSLKQRRLAIAVGSPKFAPYVGFTFDGSTQYIRTGFIPSTHAVAFTGTDMEASVYEAFDVEVLTAAMGVVAGGNQIQLYPQITANRFFGAVNTGTFTGSGATTSVGLTSIYRESGVFGYAHNGARISTGGTSSSTGLPTAEVFLGAYNNGGVATFPRASTLSFAAIGGSLSAVQEAGGYANLAALFTNLPIPDTYVSSVSFGGIPIGVDATATGDASAPFLTLDAAFAWAPPGGRIRLNGNPASLPTYTLSSTIDRALTIEAINPLGAILANGSGITNALLISPTGGQTITLNKLVIDPSLNTAGAATHGIDIGTQTTAFRVNLNGCTIQNWGAAGFAIRNAASNCKVYLTATNLTLTNTTGKGGIDIRSLSEGWVNWIGGSTTFTTANSASVANCGGMVVAANVAGLTGQAINVNVAATLHASLTGTAIYHAIRFIDMQATINGGTHAVLGAPGAWVSYTTGVTTSGTAGGVEMPISGSLIENVTWQNTTNGGIGVYFNDDHLADRTKATGLIMQDCTGQGSAASVAGGLHGYFLMCTTGAIGQRLAVTTAGIGLVNKWSDGAQFIAGLVTDCNSSYFLAKGTKNAVFQGGTATAHSGFAGNGFFIESDASSPIQVDSNALSSSNTVVNAGAAALVFELVQTLNVLTFAGTNSFQKTSGTMAANPWSMAGVNYALFSGPGGYQASVDPASISNVP